MQCLESIICVHFPGILLTNDAISLSSFWIATMLWLKVHESLHPLLQQISNFTTFLNNYILVYICISLRRNNSIWNQPLNKQDFCMNMFSLPFPSNAIKIKTKGGETGEGEREKHWRNWCKVTWISHYLKYEVAKQHRMKTKGNKTKEKNTERKKETQYG
jgi:hypothetical protein